MRYCEICYSTDGGHNRSDWTKHAIGEIGAFQTRVLKTQIGQAYSFIFYFQFSEPCKRDMLAGAHKSETAG